MLQVLCCSKAFRSRDTDMQRAACVHQEPQVAGLGFRFAQEEVATRSLVISPSLSLLTKSDEVHLARRLRWKRRWKYVISRPISAKKQCNCRNIHLSCSKAVSREAGSTRAERYIPCVIQSSLSLMYLQASGIQEWAFGTGWGVFEGAFAMGQGGSFLYAMGGGGVWIHLAALGSLRSAACTRLFCL